MKTITYAEQTAFTQGYNAGYSQGQSDAVSQFREPSTEQSGGEQKGEYSIADLMVDAERQFYLLQTITTPAPPKDKDEFVKGFMEGSFFCSSLRERQLQEQVTALNLELGTLRVENVQKDDLIKELQDQQSEQSGGTEQEEFAMKFLEYASGLAVSNYKSGGNWYLSDGRIVKTADILKQFKEESKL